MKKFIFILLTVFCYVNVSTAVAQGNTVPVMDRFVFRQQGTATNNNPYPLANVYITIKNLRTGVVFRANGVQSERIYGGTIQYTLKTNRSFDSVRETDNFEITVAFNSIQFPIKSFVSYAGVDDPKLTESNKKFVCYMTANCLSGVTRSPIPFVTLYFNGY